MFPDLLWSRLLSKQPIRKQTEILSLHFGSVKSFTNRLTNLSAEITTLDSIQITSRCVSSGSVMQRRVLLHLLTNAQWTDLCYYTLIHMSLTFYRVKTYWIAYISHSMN